MPLTLIICGGARGHRLLRRQHDTRRHRRAAETGERRRLSSMTCAGIRSAFAGNRIVQTPGSTGWPLTAWYSGRPGSRRRSAWSVALPLLTGSTCRGTGIDSVWQAADPVKVRTDVLVARSDGRVLGRSRRQVRRRSTRPGDYDVSARITVAIGSKVPAAMRVHVTEKKRAGIRSSFSGTGEDRPFLLTVGYSTRTPEDRADG